MTTSLRAGLASLAQIDPSLDEASATLRSTTASTLRRVALPLVRPAIVAALGYSFISAMTSISAVIFLTSPRFDMATVNIVGRAEVGEYGYATRMRSVLIVLMIVVVVLIRALVGRRGVFGAAEAADAEPRAGVRVARLGRGHGGLGDLERAPPVAKTDRRGAPSRARERNRRARADTTPHSAR
jgi:iron(III) transport system permease protein